MPLTIKVLLVVLVVCIGILVRARFAQSPLPELPRAKPGDGHNILDLTKPPARAAGTLPPDQIAAFQNYKAAHPDEVLWVDIKTSGDIQNIYLDPRHDVFAIYSGNKFIGEFRRDGNFHWKPAGPSGEFRLTPRQPSIQTSNPQVD